MVTSSLGYGVRQTSGPGSVWSWVSGIIALRLRPLICEMRQWYFSPRGFRGCRQGAWSL